MSWINAALWNAKTRRRVDIGLRTWPANFDFELLNRNRDFSSHLNVVQLNVRKRHCVAWNLLLRYLWIFMYLNSHQVPEFFSTRTSINLSDIRVTNATATLEFLDFSVIFRSFLQMYCNARKIQLGRKWVPSTWNVGLEFFRYLNSCI